MTIDTALDKLKLQIKKAEHLQRHDLGSIK